MKRLVLFFSFCILMSATFLAGATSKAIKGESNTAYGDYTITLIKNEAGIGPVYQLKYANSPMLYTVKVCKEKDCCNYVVYADNVELMYTCKNGAFGARKMDKKYVKKPSNAALDDINREAFYRQKVIVADGSAQTTETALGLLACYLPEIVG